MAAAAEPLPYGESEYDLAGLTELPSRLVTPPRVAESPVAYECRTLQVIRTNPGVTGGGNLVLGEVVCAHIDDALVNERWHVDANALRAIGRMGGPEYCRTRDRFSMPRGRAAVEHESAE